jgi:hypothetical protein
LVWETFKPSCCCFSRMWNTILSIWWLIFLVSFLRWDPMASLWSGKSMEYFQSTIQSLCSHWCERFCWAVLSYMFLYNYLLRVSCRQPSSIGESISVLANLLQLAGSGNIRSILRIRVRVRVTLPLAVYPQSVHLELLLFNSSLNTCGYNPYVTSSLMRGWVSHLQLPLGLASAVNLGSESRGTR